MLGAKEQDLDLKSVANLSEALCSKQIDAYGLVMGHPNRIVLETSKRCAIRFMSVEGAIREQLLQGVKYYQRSQIPARIYPGNLKATPTFAIAATLVTNAITPDKDVYRLTKAMLSQQTSFNEQTYGYANLFHKARNKNRPGAQRHSASGGSEVFRGVESRRQAIAGDGEHADARWRSGSASTSTGSGDRHSRPGFPHDVTS